jgi:hypothetical protein
MVSAATAALLLLGVVAADTIDAHLAYALIVASALLSTALWIWAGARGIPIVPIFALGHIVYFALPILRGSPAELGYDDSETLTAAVTVAIYLVLVGIASQVPTLGIPPAREAKDDPNDRRELRQLLFAGLVVGVFYQSAIFVGGLSDSLGYYTGVVRAVALTLVTAACYLFGVALGRKELGRTHMVVAALLLLANVAVSWLSLFLVGGVVFLLATALGYSVASTRVPWRTALAALVVVGVLHAGKQEMRDKYWEPGTNYSDISTLPSGPALLAEWVEAGIGAIVSGDAGKDISQRTSLVWILLHVERVAPRPIPYLDGATYALLPQMLVPRFLDPEKIPSQAAMNLLNVHFGILTEEATQRTAVGWGPLAEAYGNFGYVGVIAAGMFVGLLGGGLTRWSAGASPVSLPALLSIAVMLQMTNLEADLAYLVVSSLQSAAGVMIYFGAFRFLTQRRRKRAERALVDVPLSVRRG